jgi:hypothetical protein
MQMNLSYSPGCLRRFCCRCNVFVAVGVAVAAIPCAGAVSAASSRCGATGKAAT